MNPMWNHLDQTQTPSPEAVSASVGSPLWDALCQFAEEQFGAKPLFEYSRCCVPGWNLKYKKAGRSLCTLYPMEGFFTALVVIGERERPETELILPTLTPYLQTLYRDTKTGMGQKWLMIEVRDEAVLQDVKQLIVIRRGAPPLPRGTKK